ncbi:MAG TPA: DUF4920 domain-containing protein [Gillisia sp.]|nr:DUF4920 domain-containing protein [Gillisia sp.]
MKNLLILPLIAMLSLTSCKNVEDKNPDQTQVDLAYNSYGEQISAENSLSASEMEEKFKDLKPGDTLEVSFSTKVNSVCKNKGCWMTLDLPQDEDVMVKFKDYGFFVPKDIEEKEVVVNGKAYVAEVSVEEQKHYAEDKGQTPEEIAAITEPKRTLSFLADGVLIKE